MEKGTLGVKAVLSNYWAAYGCPKNLSGPIGPLEILGRPMATLKLLFLGKKG